MLHREKIHVIKISLTYKLDFEFQVNPILFYFFFLPNSRLVVNTLSCVLVYHFEKVTWDYEAPRERAERCKSSVSEGGTVKPIHAQRRALKVQCVGSPIHRQQQQQQQQQKQQQQIPYSFSVAETTASGITVEKDSIANNETPQSGPVKIKKISESPVTRNSESPDTLINGNCIDIASNHIAQDDRVSSVNRTIHEEKGRKIIEVDACSDDPGIKTLRAQTRSRSVLSSCYSSNSQQNAMRISKVNHKGTVCGLNKSQERFSADDLAGYDLKQNIFHKAQSNVAAVSHTTHIHYHKETILNSKETLQKLKQTLPTTPVRQSKAVKNQNRALKHKPQYNEYTRQKSPPLTIHYTTITPNHKESISIVNKLKNQNTTEVKVTPANRVEVVRSRAEVVHSRVEVVRSRARCRSAPINRTRVLSKNERGVTSSTDVTSSILKNKIVLPPKKLVQHADARPPHETVASPNALTSSSRKQLQKSSSVLKSQMSPSSNCKLKLRNNNNNNNRNTNSPVERFTDLKIKTFHFQLQFENELREKSFTR